MPVVLFFTSKRLRRQKAGRKEKKRMNNSQSYRVHFIYHTIMNSRKFNYHVNLITFNDSQEWHLTLNSSTQKQFIMMLSLTFLISLEEPCLEEKRLTLGEILSRVSTVGATSFTFIFNVCLRGSVGMCLSNFSLFLADVWKV